MKIIELTIADNSADIPGLEAISLVESPATEVNFLALSKNKTSKSFKFEEVKAADKQMIYGVALRPNKLILRKTPAGEYYSIYFSEATVERCAAMYMTKNINSFTVDHENNIKNINVIENWIVSDPSNDKANALGLSIVKGDWVMGAKVENEGIWKRIKARELKGYSVEGFFTEVFSKLSLKKEIIEDEFIDARLDAIEAISDREVAIESLLDLYNILKTN